jgi:hypothetical protein
MPALSPQQTAVVEKLLENGLEIVSFPLYPNSIGVRKGSCATLLAPQTDGGIKLLGTPSFLIDGQLSVRLSRDGQEFYVWKKKELLATPEHVAELEAFRKLLAKIIG